MTMLQYLQEDFWFYVLNLLGFGLVALVTWLWTRLKATQIERHYQTQIEALRLAQLQQLKTSFDLTQQREHMRRLIYGMQQALQQDQPQYLRQYRHQLSHQLILNYLPAANQLLDFQAHQIKESAWIEDQVVPVLETCRQVLAALNAPSVRQALPTPTEVVLEAKEVAKPLQLLRQAGQKGRAQAYAKALDLSKAA